MKIISKLKDYFTALMYGMKITEDNVLRQIGESTNDDTNITQTVESKRVSHALLRGEVTQEVEELRYRTYKVDRESKNFEYYSPTLAKKIEKQDSKFVKYENSDNLELITIQLNNPLVETLEESVVRIDKKDKNKINYYIQIKREDFLPRYRIEEYTKRLVVRKHTEPNRVVLDFYISKYPNPFDLKSKGIVREVEHIKDEKRKSDVVLLKEVSFITSHAYGKPDMLSYKFRNIYFKEVVEYDGHYILRFTAGIVENGIDLTSAYYSATMEAKYANKEAKEVSYDVTGNISEQIYVCEECGKEIKFNLHDIATVEEHRSRSISEEEEDDVIMTPPMLEYLDMEIAEQTFGKKLCKDCIKKYLEKS